jgi:hypothetical protein
MTENTLTTLYAHSTMYVRYTVHSLYALYTHYMSGHERWMENELLRRLPCTLVLNARDAPCTALICCTHMLYSFAVQVLNARDAYVQSMLDRFGRYGGGMASGGMSGGVGYGTGTANGRSSSMGCIASSVLRSCGGALLQVMSAGYVAYCHLTIPL